MSLSAWKETLLKTWSEQSEDNISLAAAGVAFYGLLALVPLLGAIVLTYGLAADPQSVFKTMRSLTAVLPVDVARLIGDQLMSIVQTSGSKKGMGLLIALAVALWGARNAATSVILAINMAYEVEETRTTVRINLLALALTAGGVAMAVLALFAIAALGYLQNLLPHLAAALVAAGKWLSYLALLLAAAAGAATLYRFAPSHHEARWQWITPGSILSSLLWLALTFAFGFYVAHFGNYDRTYGTLATVVVLVTWMYLSAYVFLLGAELNCAIEKRPLESARGNVTAFHGQAGSRSYDPNSIQRSIINPAAIERPKGDRSGMGRLGGAEGSAAGVGEDGPALPANAPPFSMAELYAVSRVTSRSGRLAGIGWVGLIPAVLSSVGLALLKKRGREGLGAVLVASAVGLSLLNRKD